MANKKYKLEIVIETSWTDKDDVKQAIKTIIEERLDKRSNTTREVERINSFKIEKIE